MEQASVNPGRPIGAEDPRDAIAEVLRYIDPCDDFEPDIEWEPEVVPLRRVRRGDPGFPPEHDYEISREA